MSNMVEFCRACCKELTLKEASFTLKVCATCRKRITPARLIHLDILASLQKQFERFNNTLERHHDSIDEGEDWKG